MCLLGYTMQVCMVLPSFRTEKRAQSQQQKYQWFYEWGDITRLKQDPEVTHRCVQQMARQDMVAVFIPRDGGNRRTTSCRGIDGSSVTREITEGQNPHRPFDKQSRELCSKGRTSLNIISQGLGHVCRKVSHVSRVQVKQVLVMQGMYRGEENSRLGCPDCVPTERVTVQPKLLSRYRLLPSLQKVPFPGNPLLTAPEPSILQVFSHCHSFASSKVSFKCNHVMCSCYIGILPQSITFSIQPWCCIYQQSIPLYR